MNVKLTLTALLAGLTLASWTTASFADDAKADCEVREHGEKKKGQSGPCLYSQRQGFIDIRLANGKEYNLTPKEDKPGVFQDQKGRRVERTQAEANMHKYQWEHRNITVKFE